MERVVVVGGGILGAMHAWQAVRRGHQVVHLEREPDARGASLRNFGLVWVGGRAGGPELDLAIRSRQLWEELAAEVPAVGFRPNGSLTVARRPDEWDVLVESAKLPDAGRRAWELLDADETRRANPAVQGRILGSLACRLDATVEPRLAARSIHRALEAGAPDAYTWLPGCTAREVRAGAVRDHLGRWHSGDRVLLCTGADHSGVAGEALAGAPLRRVRLQMMQTERHPVALTTSLADGDSLRYYPAYAVSSLQRMTPQSELAAGAAVQLLLVQRLDGSLTVGDTHAYEEPFDFDLREDLGRELLGRAEAILGATLPPVALRWAGVYSQTTDGSTYLRREIDRGVEVITGPGGRGMTLSAAIAEETFS